MKTPIEPADIRKGDLIRWEPAGPEAGIHAIELVTNRDGQAYLPEFMGSHFLLDRPKPPVQLPENPTLGWLTAYDNTSLASWRQFDSGTVRSSISTGESTWELPSEDVTAFTPATAVPTEALDKFRHLRETRNLTNGDIDAFLAAVDGASA